MKAGSIQRTSGLSTWKKLMMSIPPASILSKAPLRSRALSEPPWPSGDRAIEIRRCFQENLSVEADGGHPTLFEKGHPGTLQTKITHLVKERFGRRVVLVARHDEPGNRFPVALARSDDLFSENLKKVIS